MPFPIQKPFSFDADTVRAISPGQVGCYGLFRRDRWIFVGAGDIRQRLLGDLRSPWILRQRPTHWVAVAIPDLRAEERRLIEELDPICNLR